jgi:hypothetical protein
MKKLESDTPNGIIKTKRSKKKQQHEVKRKEIGNHGKKNIHLGIGKGSTKS